MGSLQETEAAAAAVQKTPNRVTLDRIHRRIQHVEYFHPELTPHATVAVVTMVNGFIVLGMSAPADAGNFDAELGERLAREDAVRQIWKLEGYLLREQIHSTPSVDADGHVTFPGEPGWHQGRKEPYVDGPADG